MTKGRLKDRKRNQEKAKSVQNYSHEKNAEVDRKEGEKQKPATLPLLKRALLSDENSLDDDIQRVSIKKRKKSRKDRDVDTSEPSSSIDDKRESKGKKKRMVEVEFTGTANFSVREESDCKGKPCFESDTKRKELRDNYLEHSKRENNKETKEPKVEVSERRRKRKRDERNFYEVQQDINQIGDAQTICESKNVSSDEVKDKRKKEKRKKEIEIDNTLDTTSDNNSGLSKEVDTEKTDSVKKKKKKKSKHQPGEATKATIHPGVDYLLTWHFDKSNWNFKKVRQVWLLQNMFDQEQVSKII